MLAVNQYLALLLGWRYALGYLVAHDHGGAFVYADLKSLRLAHQINLSVDSYQSVRGLCAELRLAIHHGQKGPLIGHIKQAQ